MPDRLKWRIVVVVDTIVVLLIARWIIDAALDGDWSQMLTWIGVGAFHYWVGIRRHYRWRREGATG